MASLYEYRLVGAAAAPHDGDRDGDTYVASEDFGRLNAQQQRTYNAMEDGDWRTLVEISGRTGDPITSISARLRDLRKPQFGGHTVERRAVAVA